MANLLGQLGLQRDTREALRLLSTAATNADALGDPELASPIFVWAMILAGEFDAPGVDPVSLPKDPVKAGEWMRKAAYLCHVCAFGLSHARLTGHGLSEKFRHSSSRPVLVFRYSQCSRSANRD